MQKSETKFRKSCDRFLDSLSNCVHESIQQVAIRASADKIFCIHGWGIWSEIKDEIGTPDPLQSYKISKWRSKAKGIAFIWRPQNDKLIRSFLSLLDAGIFDTSIYSKIIEEEK